MKIIIAGDYAPIGRFNKYEEPLIKDNPSFEKLKSLFEKADYSFVNLESPVFDKTLPPINKTGPNLSGKKKSLLLLEKIGASHVTLANNHIMDYGREGLEETLETLDESGIKHVGAGLSRNIAEKTLYERIGDETLAIINIAENEWATTTSDYSPGCHSLNEIENYYKILEAKRSADYVVVISHGGHEMYQLPSPRMKKLFRFFIDAGADAVINHHPHCISGYETYKNKPIYYSTGNFLFDKGESKKTIWNEGILVELNLSKGHVKHEYHSFFQSTEGENFRFHTKEEVSRLNNELHRLSHIINDDKALEKSFQSYCKDKERQYKSYIEPHRNRYLLFLQNRKIIGSFLSNRKRRLLLNLIRCEAHRDVLIETLKKSLK